MADEVAKMKDPTEISEILCTGFGHPNQMYSHLSITRKGGGTERFAVTESNLDLWLSELMYLRLKWKKPDAA